ncbi:S49 family peptidase [bacterium endosymbiont of Escarpia laminata]|nr:MAG: S49 family peptidase [bacterium endosymbiont of Escarpia laminata]
MSDIKSGKPRSQSIPSDWERELVDKVVLGSIAESRRSRRWGIFFKSLTFLYLFVLLALWWNDDLGKGVSTASEYTALVEVNGVIAPDTKASADKVVTGLRNAFEDKKTKGIILRMNTPGGSPVQSRYIYEEITRLRKENPKIKVYAVIVDICASGGYYIAAAADEIYADKGSLVGSIGVLMNGFGFVDVMQGLGIERRLMTAGENKGIMDPFSPVDDSDKAHIQRLLDQLHVQFINSVREGRGERLKVTEYPEIFSGLFWSGEDALKMGLVDNFGSSSYVAREIIGAEEIVDFTVEEDVWDRFAERLGAGAAETLARITGFANNLQLR